MRVDGPANGSSEGNEASEARPLVLLTVVERRALFSPYFE